MIIDAFVSFAAAAFSVFLGWLPDTAPVDTFTGVASTAVTWTKAANGFFPVITLAIAVSVLLGFELLLKLWDLIVFVYHQFWGSS